MSNLLWFVPHVYQKSDISTPLHCYYGVRIHSYDHPQHGKVLKHFIYTLDESIIQSEVDLGIYHVILIINFYPPPLLLWCQDTFICPSTAWEGD
jgi:hypothetical protein